MIEALSYSFMQHALLAGFLSSLACGIVGSLVVVGRMVFLAGGIAHAAYGGVGLAIFLGLPVLPCAMSFTTGASLLMGMATLKQHKRTDTVIGVMWAAGMAFGIVLLDFTPGYTQNLMSFLFGSILTVPTYDLWIMCALDLLIFIFVLVCYKDILLMSFDREYAKTRGVPVTFLHFIIPALIALSVVMIVQVVGLILVIALLTIPARLAEKTAKNLGSMMFLACIYAFFFCLIGLWFAYDFNLTPGACIIAVASCAFVVWSLVQKAVSCLTKQHI